MNDSVTEVFIEQPLASPGSANYTLFVLGLNLGYTVKYSPLPFKVSSGFALGNSLKPRAIFDGIFIVSSGYKYSIKGE